MAVSQGLGGVSLPTPKLPVHRNLPQNQVVRAAVGLPDNEGDHSLASVEITNGNSSIDTSITSASLNMAVSEMEAMILQLQDGTTYQGTSFGAKKSIAGELVFQTGMVGYPESITDPSYRGQILVVTFPLVGNYGVPSRDTLDQNLEGLPAHFESSQVHVAGLVVASYAGEDYSHYLATSSLGTWLKEQNVPAMYGVDTRALTKIIRQDEITLGKMLAEGQQRSIMTNGHTDYSVRMDEADYEDIDFSDPNEKNLVADGEISTLVNGRSGRPLTSASLDPDPSSLSSACRDSVTSFLRASDSSFVR